MSTVLATLGMTLVLAPSQVGPQPSAALQQCMNKAGNPTQMAACQDREVRRLQNLVAQEYRQLIDTVKQHKTFGKDDKVLARVEAEKRAWDRYAGVYLDALYPVPESDRVTEFGKNRRIC